MAYISSGANRWYCALETAYGQLPAISSANRIPAVKLKAQQQRSQSARRDKTGSRTWAGVPAGMRRSTSFDLTSYVVDWQDTTALPPQGALLQAAFGAAPVLWPGSVAAAGCTQSVIVFPAPHGLTPGQAITWSGEIRFVGVVPNANSVVLNAPFTTAPSQGAPLGTTANYSPGWDLPSLSLFDYWDPANAVQRILLGAGIDKVAITLNGDFHEFEFKGVAKDVVDSVSFVSGQGGAATFPHEPAIAPFSYSPVPGNMGQVWFGSVPNRFFTVAEASIEVRNNLSTRANEFGSNLPQGIMPGEREVSVSLELFGQDDAATQALYQAARQESPLSLMFQLGQTNGQLLGIYLKSLVPDVPQFDDSDSRLKWKFTELKAQGTVDDEIVVAFG